MLPLVPTGADVVEFFADVSVEISIFFFSSGTNFVL
jgi:hypothetical protein